MRKINFGKVIFPPYYQDRTLKQSAIQDVINNVFYMPHPDLPASTIIHRNLRADILIKNLKNGNTEIHLTKSKKPQNVKFSDKFIEENIGKYTINCKDSLGVICEKLEDFADKCVEAAKKYSDS